VFASAAVPAASVPMKFPRTAAPGPGETPGPPFPETRLQAPEQGPDGRTSSVLPIFPPPRMPPFRFGRRDDPAVSVPTKLPKTESAAPAAMPTSPFPETRLPAPGAARATVGGPSRPAGNLISGNSGPGIEIAFDSEETVVEGNRIGMDATDAAAALPNAEGLRLRDGARRSTVGGADSGTDGNHIAFNTGAGVVLEFSAGAGNAILSNSIHDNGALGIDFGGDGVTANHGPEAGARASVNFPVLTKVTPYSVEGTLDATPHTGYTLQFFSNEQCDPSGYGQGQTQIATWNVTTDAGGHADFGVSLTAAPGQGVAATATSAAAGTSEFSPCVLPETEEGPAESLQP